MNGIIDNLTSAVQTWNEKMAEIWTLLTQSPEEFKGGDIWKVIQNIHGALLAIGIALLVLFFVFGLVKTCTSVRELIDYCGGFTDEDVLVKMGGPMMGFPLNTLDVPMMKGSNGIIAIDTDETKEQPCIKCGRCVDVCPMELSPLYFVKYAKEENWQGMKDMNVMDCVECRCCQYICSSKIPIINSIKAGKNAIRGMK